MIEIHGAEITQEADLQSQDFLDAHPIFRNQKIHKTPPCFVAQRGSGLNHLVAADYHQPNTILPKLLQSTSGG
jgi:hypothetical protein